MIMAALEASERPDGFWGWVVDKSSGGVEDGEDVGVDVW